MQLQCAGRVQSLTTCKDDGGKSYRTCKKNMILHHCMTFFPLVAIWPWVSFITSLQSRLSTALTIQNTTEKNCIILHSHNMTVLQANACLTLVHQIPLTIKWQAALRSANNCQCQFQTPQSASVTTFEECHFSLGANYSRGRRVGAPLSSLSVPGFSYCSHSLLCS